MKVAQINTTCGAGSTGKIAVSISELLTEKSVENYILYASGTSDYPLGIKYMSNFDVKLQALCSHMLGNYGFNSVLATKRLISELEHIHPDVVHLHNLHGHNCNLEMLFSYFKKSNIKLVWTFHDCWAFTAYCPHFVMDNCSKWETNCEHCPSRKNFSYFFDKSSVLYKKKKALLVDQELTVVTPSEWLANLVKRSFLKDFDVRVINNGIDLSVFKPTISDFREKNAIGDKFILLGVAFGWGKRKGLDVFEELSKRLDSEKYQIVLVGVDEDIQKQLPSNIISIKRTRNQNELAKIYSAANLFVNPTREENYPTVNLESIACGTPVITFNTGGSAEMLDSFVGAVVECDDVDVLEREIINICENGRFSQTDCLKKAESFDMNDKFLRYIDLYEEIYEKE